MPDLESMSPERIGRKERPLIPTGRLEDAAVVVLFPAGPGELA